MAETELIRNSGNVFGFWVRRLEVQIQESRTYEWGPSGFILPWPRTHMALKWNWARQRKASKINLLFRCFLWIENSLLEGGGSLTKHRGLMSTFQSRTHEHLPVKDSWAPPWASMNKDQKLREGDSRWRCLPAVQLLASAPSLGGLFSDELPLMNCHPCSSPSMRL